MSNERRSIGNVLAPWPFLVFGLVSVLASAGLWVWLGFPRGLMGGFDLGALAFLAACAPLFNDAAAQMRRVAASNDANRGGLLLISFAVTVVILATVGNELAHKAKPLHVDLVLVIATLALCWIFSNLVYALHYAHLFYKPDADGNDVAGLKFPGTSEPDY